MRTKKKSFLGILLSLALMIGMMPALGLSQTAYADGTTYNPASTYTGFGDLITNDTEVTISEVSGKTWYVIGYNSTDKTVTLLSKQSFENKPFNSDFNKGIKYVGSDIEAYVKGLINDGQPLAGIKDSLADISGKVTGKPDNISGAVPYLLSEDEANVLSTTKKSQDVDSWWLRTPYGDEYVKCIWGGSIDRYNYSNSLAVRPALKLDLSSVIFGFESKTFSLIPAEYNVTITAGSNMTKTETSGAASQTGLPGPMTAVVYTANEGYYFPENYSVEAVNGISVTRDSYTQITVSGTPTADAEITLTAPTAKEASVVTKAPEAKILTYNGQAQELVTAGTATGGEMRYALGTASEATQPYTTSIPTATDAGTYYVWYKAIGDDTHSDSKAACVKVTIKEEPKPAKVSGTLMAKMTAKGKTKLAISWNKIKGAAGYDIFFAKCGKKVKKVKSIKGNKTFKWTKSGLKKGKTYLAAVKAYVMKDGKKKYVSNSPYAHAYAGNGNKKFTNAKSVKVKKAKVTLKKGKTFKIKAKVTKVKKSKKLMPKKHVATVRYLSTDKKIATVSSKGKIKAVAKGKCTIYAYAHNGVSRSIKVTVK